MNVKPVSIIKIGSGRSLSRKISDLGSASKTRSSSAESSAKISLKNIVLRKSKENLLPKDKLPNRPRCATLPKLQKLDLNIRDINNSFYRRLSELEPKLSSYCRSYPECFKQLSPQKQGY